VMPTEAAQSQPRHRLAELRGICDTHIHIIGPKHDYPLAPERTYTPPDAPVERCLEMLGRVGTERVVLVQPSIYGEDHRCLLHALSVLGERARAVAVLQKRSLTARELDEWDRCGVRGLRLNAVTAQQPMLPGIGEDLARLARIAETKGWHVQIFADFATLHALEQVLLALPTPIVIDHFGLAPVEGEAGAQAIGFLEKLLSSGRAWLKLSGVYKVSKIRNHADLPAFVRRLAFACPERLLWGTDWPHTPSHGSMLVHDTAEMPYREIDTPGLLRLVVDWIGAPVILHRILFENPARLYGFAQPAARSLCKSPVTANTSLHQGGLDVRGS
jgi:predicted TIM-barrel fold metal-dependent hydrolase